MCANIFFDSVARALIKHRRSRQSQGVCGIEILIKTQRKYYSQGFFTRKHGKKKLLRDNNKKLVFLSLIIVLPR